MGSDNGLSPVWRQAIISTIAGLLSIRPLGANFSEILIKIWNIHENASENIVCEKVAILSNKVCISFCCPCIQRDVLVAAGLQYDEIG